MVRWEVVGLVMIDFGLRLVGCWVDVGVRVVGCWVAVDGVGYVLFGQSEYRCLLDIGVQGMC